ncbi:MAG: hypothetical protein U5N86_03885 [Planctomycetota bacterium]|nr:hypothetical protein [Planctomycetota bacterium]
MTTIITCAKCNRDYDVTRLRPGTRIKCKECGNRLTVPSENVISCANCSQVFRAKSMKEGSLFRCTKCGMLMKVLEGGETRQVSSEKKTAAPDSGRNDFLEPVGAENRAQQRTPPPASRRFDSPPHVKTLEQMLDSEDILGAFLVDKDGVLLSAHTDRQFDSELLANSTVLLNKISRFICEQFELSPNGVATMRIGDASMRVTSHDKGHLAVVHKAGRYDGEHDEKIVELLEKTDRKDQD